ncbi:MAG: transcription termination/antitermination protein NusG [Treponema sp.]|jgi:transcriptional antiterminator NusG|nr:transcription termination/antitermination protein NusG [Treponema sp.]
MATGWYILHVYSGFESRIEKTIRMMIDFGDLDKEIVRDVKAPSESTVEIKDGKKRTQTRLMLPGYMLVELDLPDDNWKATCQKIRQIQGVTGFVGTPVAKKPQPLPSEEVRSILQKSGDIKGERFIHVRQSFSEGEQVKIVDGPFESFTGVIEEIDSARNKLKVMVGIFGRNTPVEVDLLQVEKV